MPGDEFEDFVLDHVAAVSRLELDRQLAGARHLEVRRAVLVAEGVTADHDRLRPARHEARHVLHHDRFAEHDAVEDVADRAVGRLPHLLEVEFLHAGFIRRDGRALHGDAVLFGRFGRVDGDLVVGGVAVLDRQVVILQVDVEIRQDQALLDERPDDPGHLIPVHFDDGVCNLDDGHEKLLKGDVTGQIGF